MRNQKAANKANSWQATKFTYMGKKRESKPLVLDLCAPFPSFFQISSSAFQARMWMFSSAEHSFGGGTRDWRDSPQSCFSGHGFDSGHGCFPADWEVTLLPISQCYPKIKNVFFLRCSWISSTRLPSLVLKKSKASPKQSSAVFWLQFFSF